MLSPIYFKYLMYRIYAYSYSTLKKVEFAPYYLNNYRNLLKFGKLVNWANTWGCFYYFWVLGPNFGPFLVGKTLGQVVDFKNHRNLLKFGTLVNWAYNWGCFYYFWALGPNFGPFLARNFGAGCRI